MDTVLSGRWSVYYGAENRQKRVKWTGGTAAADTVKSLYLALQDLFDELLQMDDGTVISAQTPTEYTVGIIDPGDKDPWFLDMESVEHLKGGAVKSASWKRVESSNVGIVKLTAVNVDIVSGDVGLDIVSSYGDAGTLLDFKDLGGGDIELWIRPDTWDAADSFNHTDGTLTCNVHTATQSTVATTGEMLWANTYALGTLVEDTHLYVYQGVKSGDTAPDAIVEGYKSTWNWWGDGFFDVLICVANQALSLTDRQYFTDQGYVSVLARQYGQTNTYYIVDLFAGGRNPIPLETGTDLNNATGFRTVTLSASSGNWNVGDEVMQTTGTNTGARGKITAISGANPTITLRYYLIGNVSLDFENGETLANQDDTGTGTSGTPADFGPALLAGLSVVHTARSSDDIDENGTPEYYSIAIDCSDEALADVYEWLKWQCRDGNIGTGNTDAIEAEQYIGSDYRITYTAITGAVAEGDVVTQVTTLARGTVVAHHTTPKILILRNCRGAFNNTDQVEVDAGNYVTGPASVAVTPVKACPFGLFAGGVLFAAAGVVLINFQAGELNNFQLTDDQGNVVTAPIKITLAISNTRVKDRLAWFRLTGESGDIEKSYYAIDTVTAIGDTTISVDPVIRVTEPGKVAGGILFILDADAQREDRYRFTGWAGDDFTLFNKVADVAEAGTDPDTIVATGGFANCLVGDIIYNSDRTAITYIKSITSDDEVEVYPSVAGQTTGDNFRVGACAAIYEITNDKVYVPFIHAHEIADGSEEALIVASGTIYCRIRARHANDTSNNIKPFETDVTVTNTNASVSVIRTPETITS